MIDEVQQPGRRTARGRLFLCGGLLAVLTAVALAWSLTPLGDLVDPGTMAAAVDAIRAHPAAPWLTMAGFLVGGLLVLPITLMNVFTVVVFGPLPGFVVALTGTTLSALASFGIGRLLGHRALARLAGSRIHGLSLRLRAGGSVAVAALRLVPVAHFTVLSLAAGTSHLRIRDYVVGTVLGMAPGIAVIALLVDRVNAVNVRPGPAEWLILAVASAGMLVMLLTLQWLSRRVRQRTGR